MRTPTEIPEARRGLKWRPQPSAETGEQWPGIACALWHLNKGWQTTFVVDACAAAPVAPLGELLPWPPSPASESVLSVLHPSAVSVQTEKDPSVWFPALRNVRYVPVARCCQPLYGRLAYRSRWPRWWSGLWILHCLLTGNILGRG